MLSARVYFAPLMRGHGEATAKVLRVRYFDLIFHGGPPLAVVNLE